MVPTKRHWRTEWFCASRCPTFFSIVVISSSELRLMNTLKPNAIAKYSTSGGAFKLRENISIFRKWPSSIYRKETEWIRLENAARAYGLGDHELFQTIDLFEKRNIAQVTQCIFALGRNVSVCLLILSWESPRYSLSVLRLRRRSSMDPFSVRRCLRWTAATKFHVRRLR